MEITAEKDTDTRQKLTVKVASSSTAAEEKKILGEYVRQARIPGFRPGKAPVAMIKKRFADKISEQLQREVINSAYKNIQEREDLKIFSVVNVEPGDISSETDASIVFTVDTLPEFELPEYKNLDIHKHPEDVTDEEIQERLDQVRNQRAEYKTVERAAEKGDYVKLSYEGKIDDKLISEIAPDKSMYGTQSVTWEEAGSEDAPGVRAIIDGIVGMKDGDKKKVTQIFKDDFEIEELAGKTATYSIEVSEVREKVLPDFDEEMLKSLEVDSVDALKERTKKELEVRKAQDNDHHMRDQIMAILEEKLDFQVPDSAVDQEVERMLSSYIQQQLMMGVTREQIEEHRDELFESAKKAANKQVKSNFILGRIAESEKIELKNEDMNQRIIQEAISTQTPPDKLVKELEKDRARLDGMRRDALFNKTLAFLIDSANVTVQTECTHTHDH